MRCSCVVLALFMRFFLLWFFSFFIAFFFSALFFSALSMSHCVAGVAGVVEALSGSTCGQNGCVISWTFLVFGGSPWMTWLTSWTNTGLRSMMRMTLSWVSWVSSASRAHLVLESAALMTPFCAMAPVLGLAKLGHHHATFRALGLVHAFVSLPPWSSESKRLLAGGGTCRWSRCG